MPTTKQNTLMAIGEYNLKAYMAMTDARCIPADGLSIRDAQFIGETINRIVDATNRLGKALAVVEDGMENIPFVRPTKG